MRAFYRAIDEARFASSALTRGPWSADAQHGGPPSALLGTGMAALAPEGFRACRLTFELLRPIGIVPLIVAAAVVRAGQQVTWIEGALRAVTARGEVEVMRARGVWVRTQEGRAPALVGAAVPGPEHGEAFTADAWKLPWQEGYHTAMELSFVAPTREHSRIAWMRPRVGLVEGAPWTALGRVLVAVDSIGGVCARLSWVDWSFVNADTTCHLLREPDGEWVALEGTQWVEPDGVGLAEARLLDERGPIGHGLQSQVVAPRR